MAVLKIVKKKNLFLDLIFRKTEQRTKNYGLLLGTDTSTKVDGRVPP